MPRSRKRKQQTDWQSVALEAQAYRDASISRVQPSIPSVPENLPPNVMHFPSKLLTRGDLDITKLPPEVLLSMLASGEITATATITAFLRHAGLAQKLVSCSLRYISILLCQCLVCRQTASQSFFLSQLWSEPGIWMTTSQSTRSRKARYMDSLSVSRSISA